MKKQRTFTQRWNATALRRIRKELTKAEDDHLCIASPEFAKLWSQHHLEIKKLALRYSYKNYHVGQSWSNCLFKPNDALDYTDWLNIRKQVRIDFLTNEIKRLTTK